MERRDRPGRRPRRLAAAGLAAHLLAVSHFAPSTGPARADEAAAPARIFISGHSLTDRPIPDDLVRIAASLGQPLAWGRRHSSGSTIRQRACRDGAFVTDEASDPDGPGGLYDTLVVTEQHDLMGAFLWNDTIGALGRLHDCASAANPGIKTWFYVPWMSLDDKDEPSAWIAYERAAAPLWHCLVAAANRRSVAARRGNPIAILPAATALVTLIERAANGSAPPGWPEKDAGRTTALLIQDQVHPTRLGHYALALVTYAAMTGRAPIGAWAPEGIDPQTARALQDFAGTVAATAAREPEPDPAACAARLRSQATEIFWPYMERAHWRPQAGLLGARVERLSKALRWRWKLWRAPGWTPFDPSSDGTG
ncbi:hypothetical protein [Methylobacterium sp. Leaf100]|uniref:hypothetical protein n=1 Tax=Methylobacterium sp. Leaf100 TaxID=1736252 RepID=UPI000700A66A|nr:hypothetical protein [Methylobacterium sp. Leaf100]KQP18655.1 hypothetical protein ASF25_12515 [Methylobacterium sp. Leaf100]